MENNLYHAFDTIHMDQACAEKIEASFASSRKPMHRQRWIAAAAVCFAIIILMNPVGVDAVETILNTAKTLFARIPGAVIIADDYVYYNDGHIELEHFDNACYGTVNTLKKPTHIKVQNERLYFIGNLEKIDITDQFSMDEPFVYIYEKDGILHYIAVGGEFDPEIGIDSVGYDERLRNVSEMEKGIAEGDLYAGWLGGYSVNRYDPETGKLALWNCKYIVDNQIPWENTEAQAILDAAE